MDPVVGSLAHPNAPRRGLLALAFLGIVFAGALGGLIGWGIVDTTCSEQPTVAEELIGGVPGHEVRHQSCGPALFAGALVGAAVAAVGAGVVAVLMLRAHSEWRSHPPVPADGALRRTRSAGSPPRT